ncbi:MAG: hypothetical protein OXC11_11020, partial [Rhodospirillales bacterium]|nr:hypothetical protein [Rhodospirillales bacterium]
PSYRGAVRTLWTALTALLLLTACGGGGGSSPTTLTNGGPESSHLAEPDPKPDPEPLEPREAVIDQHSTTGSGGVLSFSPPSADCLPGQMPCNDTPVGGFRPTPYPGDREAELNALIPKSLTDENIRSTAAILGNGDLRLWFAWPDQQYEMADILGPIESISTNGNLFSFQWDEIKAGIPGGQTVTAWEGEHAFMFGFLDPGTAHYSWVIGESSGSNPIGPLRWVGPAVGERIHGGDLMHGQADLTLGTDLLLDVRIRLGLDWGVLWPDIPIQGEGEFYGHQMSGRFYGPEHEEAAGWFYFDQVIGMFVTAQ